MSNICENELRVYSEHKENIQYTKSFIEKHFKSVVKRINNENLEIIFDSNWDFPIDEMYDLYTGIPYKDDIQIHCLSVEWGNLYCEFHSCDKEGWTNSY
jgi:hypothetical protein